MKRTKTAPEAPKPRAPRIITKQDVLESIDHAIKVRTDALAKWHAGFMDNPAQAFEWSRETFLHAAQLEVSKMLRDVVDKTGTDKAVALEMISEFMTRKVCDAARLSQSTSITANAMTTAYAEACAPWVQGGAFGYSDITFTKRWLEQVNPSEPLPA